MNDGFARYANPRIAFVVGVIFLATISASVVFGSPFTAGDVGDLTSDTFLVLGGIFAPLIAMSCSPFIALTILSGLGTFLNSGVVNPENIPLSDALMQLPISQSSFFIVLLIITLLKYGLSLLSKFKVLSDATLGKVEGWVGTICTIGGAFLIATATNVYASEALGAASSEIGAFAPFLTNLIGVVVAALAYIVFFVIRTMMTAIGVLGLLVSPIPGLTGLITTLKHILVAIYTWISLANPAAASVIGLIILLAACLVFGKTRRLVTYYRRIYLIPFAGSIFRKDYTVPLMPRKIPRRVAEEFGDIEICIESFSQNRSTMLHKRERCLFVRAGGSNYIFKRRPLGKVIRIELSTETYVEKTFGFVRVFTYGASQTKYKIVNVAIRREHGKNLNDIAEKTDLINYNQILEERKQKRTEERAVKAQQVKESAANATKNASERFRGAFKKVFQKSNSCNCCGIDIADKGSTLCHECRIDFTWEIVEK